MIKDSFCNYCGAEYSPEINYPKQCLQCHQIVYHNPLPVVVAVIPVSCHKEGDPYRKLLLARRGIQPGIGKLAFPSGYIEYGESWQQALQREVKEEINLDVKPLNVIEILNSEFKKHICIFGLTETIRKEDIDFSFTNEETQEIRLFQDQKYGRNIGLAFPIQSYIYDIMIQRINL